MITQKNIKVTGYKSDGFIGKYQKLIRDTVIPYQYSVLCDKAPDTEKSHVVKNFENAAKALRGEDVGDGFYGIHIPVTAHEKEPGIDGERREKAV